MLNSAELAQLSWAWKKFQKICQYFKIYKQNKFHAQLSWAWKKFYNLGAWSHGCQYILTGDRIIPVGHDTTVWQHYKKASFPSVSS